ncbi:uroporphyrinogen-III synthase [Hyphomicrobium sulfonivorans]|nr:uroporphyrinogen-III synthase [Hyphomicrobium sulfonivorans]NSL71096.1 uroporphyrinogen-III synthase [Hyphomicrobium sulfonivorans]
MHILVTRPKTDAAALTAQLEALGHRVSADPLLQITPLPIAADALDGAKGLVVTSRNGLRALAQSPALAAALALPLIAVGPATARHAEEIGFKNITVGEGTALSILPLIEQIARTTGGPLTHVRGEVVAFDLAGALAARGVELSPVIAYRSDPAKEFLPTTRDLLFAGAIDAVILMSPRTGATFARLAKDGGVEEGARRAVMACISSAVAAALEPLAPLRVEVAQTPDVPALLTVISRVETL